MKGKIICATRGGEGSRRVQEMAVSKALAEGKQLIFLYVSDPGSVNQVDETMLPAIRAELHWMGQTLLRIAEKRAHDAGLEADLILREGNVREEISEFVMESRADLLLLGAPRGTTANVFGDEEIEAFASSIQKATGVAVQIVRPAPIGERPDMA